MNKVTLSFLFCIVLFSCKDKDEPVTVCGVKDPANDLAWLKAVIDDLEKSSVRQYFYVSRAEYNHTVVFTVGNCCPMCNTYTPVYKCDGTQMQNPDYSQIKNSVVIWKPDDFLCVLI